METRPIYFTCITKSLEKTKPISTNLGRKDCVESVVIFCFIHLSRANLVNKLAHNVETVKSISTKYGTDNRGYNSQDFRCGPLMWTSYYDVHRLTLNIPYLVSNESLEV